MLVPSMSQEVQRQQTKSCLQSHQGVDLNKVGTEPVVGSKQQRGAEPEPQEHAQAPNEELRTFGAYFHAAVFREGDEHAELPDPTCAIGWR